VGMLAWCNWERIESALEDVQVAGLGERGCNWERIESSASVYRCSPTSSGVQLGKN